MALRYLNPNNQLAVLETLVDPTLLRRDLEQIPVLAALLPELDELAESFRSAIEATTPSPERSSSLRALDERLEALDEEHDRLVRMGHAVLSTHRFSEDLELAEEAARLTELLYPGGRTIVGRSYLEEAGAAQIADERLDGPDRAILERMTVSGTSAWDLHRRRVDVGAELLALVTERNRLRAAADDGTAAPRLRDVGIRWRRMMRVIRELADLLRLDDDARVRIHGLLDEAEARVELARSRRAPSEDEQTTIPLGSGGSAASPAAAETSPST